MDVSVLRSDGSPPLIALVSPPLAHGGGFASFTAQLLELADDLGIEMVHIASRGASTGIADVVGFVVGLARFAVLCVRRRVDLCHVNLAVRGSAVRKLAFLVIARLTRVPRIVHVHSGRFPQWLSELSLPARWAVMGALRSAVAVCVVTSSLLEDLVAAGVSSSKVHLVPNATRYPQLQHSGTDGRRVLFLGRFVHLKGVDLLLQAAAMVHDAGMLDELVLAGGQGDVDVSLLVARQQLPDGVVQVLPWQSKEQVERLLASATLLVVPSRSEGAPLIVLEAMAVGTPVVATSVGDVPTLLAGRGWIVPPDDAEGLAAAIAHALDDPREARRRASQARAYWEQHHTPEVLVRSLRHVYRSVLEAGRGY